jgi:FkbM family methyltransferase
MPHRTFFGLMAHAVNTCLGTIGISVSKIPERLTMERHIRTLLQSLDIDCVIDAGAHHGEFGEVIRNLGYKKRIVSFEPAQEAFRNLEARRAGDKAWEAHRMAMGSVNETKELMICDKTEFNSLHAPSDFGTTSKFFSPFLVSDRRESVEVKRLDSVLPELISDFHKANIYLKIDTQGHDSAVFAGAKGILPQVKALQVELASKQLYQDVPSMEEALLAYRQSGFVPSGFFPVSHEDDGITVVEWDCVLARNNAN